MADLLETLTGDEKRLAELGYAQELKRGWSSFSNFAISFSIISVLAGCFTTYGQAFNNGGPVAISIGWPVISLLILCVAFSMSELASAFPTAGGIYFWASRLGGAGWGWFTGWFNLIGLVAVVASVDYAAASFLGFLLGLYNVHFIFNFASDERPLPGARGVRAVRADPARSRPGQRIQRAPRLAVQRRLGLVARHRRGRDRRAADRRAEPSLELLLRVRPPAHFGSFGHGMYWFYVLPLGFLLTMYTITGYDASAHVSEETHGADQSAPKGVWRSVFYSAVIGWIVLLALTFAVQQKESARSAKRASRRWRSSPRRSARLRPRRSS